jgi:chemotaxis protein CheZ
MQSSTAVEQKTNNSALIQMAQEYLTQLQNGNEKQAEMVLQDINQLSSTVSESDSSEHDLYSRVGELTRKLHDSMSSFMNDTRIHMMTNEDMPDARQRLQHVVELTEKSAHTTISLIEHSNPLLLKMQVKAVMLQQQSSTLNKDLDDFLQLVEHSSKDIINDLKEIMLAQNYQDLTGQVIQRVSTLVQEVENNLLSLLKTSNKETESHAMQIEIVEKKKEKDNKGHGPVVPGVTKGDVLNSQEDVDDLLASLGF